jgi:hypothetical protein
LGQVQNTPDVKHIVNWMTRVSYQTGEKPSGIPIAVVGEPVWAFQFYLIEGGFRNYSTSDVKGTERFVISDEAQAKEIAGKLPPTHYRRLTFSLHGWFIPEYHHLSLRDWLKYAWRRETVWGIGEVPMIVFYRFTEPALDGPETSSTAN